MIPAFWRMSAVIALVLLSAAAAPAAFAKKAVAGPLAFEVPDDFTANAGAPPSLHQDSTGITLEVSELPLQALHEFKGHSFLEFLASLGYTNAAYANGALKRTDAHTYVLADAKGKQAARAARRSSPPMYRKARSKAAAPTSRQFCPAPPLCLPPRPSPKRAAQLGIRSVVGDRQPLTRLFGPVLDSVRRCLA